ncbi:MAG: hypothetical protein IT458_00860 [Planctomycetes bacterium]|nr:hypothetical protein [Planctomycetota bacterium]
MLLLARVLSVLLLAGGAGMITLATLGDPKTHTGMLSLNEIMALGVTMLIAGFLVLVLFGARAPEGPRPGRPES